MDDATESYIMLLLADGNLPTGSFVASSGLESYVKHGFFGTTSSSTSSSSSAARSNQAVTDFICENLGTYAHSALPFVSDAHLAVSEFRTRLDCLSSNSEAIKEERGSALKRLTALDDLYHTMTLNDVSRRASRAQGVALLTLFSKGFSRPSLVGPMTEENSTSIKEEALLRFVDDLKLMIRREEVQGHLPVCWGVLTAALGLSLERSQHLHLFLQARSLLSASIRLNTLGPYAAQQLLLHVVKGLVEEQMKTCKTLRTGLQASLD
ncbi:UreF-domain-containing protein [Phellopilus nigrolimitatus]|nr:UreF-domain-containing protein [Phellopilus nigrolimitatus]